MAIRYQLLNVTFRLSTFEKKKIPTSIGNEQVHGSMWRENSVSLEEGNCCGSSVGQSDLSCVSLNTGDLDGDRACCESYTSNGGNWKDVGEHVCKVDLRLT